MEKELAKINMKINVGKTKTLIIARKEKPCNNAEWNTNRASRTLSI